MKELNELCCGVMKTYRIKKLSNAAYLTNIKWSDDYITIDEPDRFEYFQSGQAHIMRLLDAVFYLIFITMYHCQYNVEHT